MLCVRLFVRVCLCERVCLAEVGAHLGIFAFHLSLPQNTYTHSRLLTTQQAQADLSLPRVTVIDRRPGPAITGPGHRKPPVQPKHCSRDTAHSMAFTLTTVTMFNKLVRETSGVYAC